jgi:ABC-type transport system substrate-binding protein
VDALRRKSWLALLMVMMLVLAACSSAGEDDPDTDTTSGSDTTTTTAAGSDDSDDDSDDSDSDTGEAQNLNVFLYQAPSAWNPFLPFHGPDQQVMDLIYQKLIINNSDFEFEGRLAESWDISEDGTTFTFNLYDGLTWNDGTPLTANDVKFSLELLANPNVAGAAGRFASVLGQPEYAAGDADEVEGFRAVDDTTFEIQLSAPNVGFLTTVAAQSVYTLPQHVLGDVPIEDLADHSFFLAPTVGYGPYNFVEYLVDQRVVLEANPDYHLGAPAIDTLTLLPLDGDVATAQLGTGELDLAFISASDIELVEGFDGVVIEPAQGTGSLRMSINHGKERFQDKRVRQAMLHAIDRQGLVDVLLEGYGDMVTVGYYTPWALPDGLNEYPYDPDRARELLAEAGWDSSEPVEIQWIPGTRDRDAAVPIIQEQWNAVGITTEIVNVEVSELIAKRDDGTYDFTLFGGGDYSVDPHPLYLVTNCDEPSWTGPGWCAQEGVEDLLALWREADATADFDERQEMYHEISRQLNDLVAYIWLYNNNTIWAHSERLQGFKAHGNFTEGFVNAHEWTISG